MWLDSMTVPVVTVKSLRHFGSAQRYTPGFLVAAKALLERNPDPTETEVRYWLAGNLCRCTGYAKIFEAVRLAAEAG